ncbi:MAG: VWA domain-containing protein [Planctomycetaceae bacterium]|nr:VWA domain-containing protein [Planctomycetaceae bacterium]
MILKLRELPGFGVSLGLHLAAFLLLALVTISRQSENFNLAVESLFDTDRAQEEFTRELNVDTEVAETFNVMAGSAVIAAQSGGSGGGSGGLGVSQSRIDASGTLQEPTVGVNVGDVNLPGLGDLGTDLGGTQISGEPTAMTEGYGAALDRITQELLRMMREEKVLAVWLFDESESMKDDQKEIREHFHKVYEELGLAVERDSKSKAEKDVLLTAIHGFGAGMHQITSKPTSDIAAIRASIDKIADDPSGKENLLTALNKLLDQYKSFVSRKRRLVFIVVTDESGDDGESKLLDEVIFKARRARAPIYILGREALFGYPYARMRWVDPMYGLTHYLQILRGPETAYPEALQFDGLNARWDATNSGCGPYEQARLTRESGGIFFVLPHEEENLHSQFEIERRKFSALDMKEYTPELISRKDYEDQRNSSKLRSTIWDVVKLINPHTDPELRISEPWWFPTDPAKFKAAGQVSFNRGMHGMALLSQAAQALEKVKPLRDKEASLRWRANFDLIYAQVLAYRVRLFQYLLALDAFANDMPRPQSVQHNAWVIHRVHEMLTPTDRQIKLTKVDMDEIKHQLETARAQYEFVIKSHPGTPWARRAEIELSQGFGMRWGSAFRDPRYDGIDLKIKFPTL